jgi:HKD family nuclease
MKTNTEILLLPYDSASGTSLLHRLIAELESGNWISFRAAIAFAKSSGNYQELVSALVKFAKNGGGIELTFGADTFGANTKGSDMEAVEVLVNELHEYPSARVFAYHEQGRTFHPKIYLFDNLQTKKALVVVGSSNWSYGGLINNIEANVLVHLDLSTLEHLEAFERLTKCFTAYWSES